MAEQDALVNEEDIELSGLTDIMDLMMPMFSGLKDNFGKDVVPPTHLLYDRICEGRAPSSTARLFKLPMEILAVITEKIPDSSLASFAFVNSDCRQLSRSRQFASIQLDYSDDSFGILGRLLDEAQERLNNRGRTLRPALGPCIRRLTVATNPGWVTLRHNVELSREFNALPKAERANRFKDANKLYFGTYLKIIQDLLSKHCVLPHLELLDWEDSALLSSPFFDAIANSTIRHLKIYRAHVDESVFTASRKPLKAWPLRSLYLDITPPMGKLCDFDPSIICTSLLHCCASTLESLTWDDCFSSAFHTDRLGPSPRFPMLHHLRASHVDFEDTTLLQELLHDELRSLDIDTECSTVCSDLFKKRGRVPSLMTFIWNTTATRIAKNPSTDFLSSNPQLSKLRFAYPAPVEFLEDQILPLLAQSFSKLSSLSLTFDSQSINRHALETISQISTLEQLLLSAGEQYGWRYNWLIDHQAMRNHLSKLTLLKRLAFDRDSYDNGISQSCDRYYVDKWIRPGDLLDQNHTEEIFEIEHREAMLDEASQYLEVMPQLEWLYLGQIPMAVDMNTKDVEPLTTERDDCYTFLKEMFGWKGILPES
ncbi:MAG: hypothetical protein Q9166_001801 [cf. Caloplaca sp. 2 TL-2023]